MPPTFRLGPPALAALLLAAVCAARAAEPLAVEEQDAALLQARMQAGELSSRSLVQAYLARIAALDQNGPRLNAVIETNPDALAIADALDAERAAGKIRGPLHGLPVLLKDNIDSADGMLTTAGSLALADSRPAADAEIVRRLRAAGAIILGKTNLSEWANFRSTRPSSGWSARGGQTRNAYDGARNPCGSSSGSAVAAAASLAALTVGTETDGSIVCPASVNGVVGLKPTVGLVSRSGIVPIAISQDTAGPITRTVTDAALLLQVLAGADPGDAATQVTQNAAPADYLAALNSDGLSGARIGVSRNLGGFHEEVEAVFDQALAVLREGGAQLVEPANIRLPAGAEANEQIVLSYEFKDGINRYLAARAGGPRDLAGLIRFNREHADSELAWFGQELFQQAQARGPLTDEAYRHAQRRARHAARNAIDHALRAHGVEVLVAPTMGAAWSIDLVNGDHSLGGAASTAAAIAGYPHLTVPMGYVHGLPVGLSFIGTAWSEPLLLKLGYAFEQRAQARRAPVYGEVPEVQIGAGGHAVESSFGRQRESRCLARY